MSPIGSSTTTAQKITIRTSKAINLRCNRACHWSLTSDLCSLVSSAFSVSAFQRFSFFFLVTSCPPLAHLVLVVRLAMKTVALVLLILAVAGYYFGIDFSELFPTVPKSEAAKERVASQSAPGAQTSSSP